MLDSRFYLDLLLDLLRFFFYLDFKVCFRLLTNDTFLDSEIQNIMCIMRILECIRKPNVSYELVKTRLM